MMVYKAVLFDLDGTLLDTIEDIAYAANRVLAWRGLPVHPKDAYRAAVGNGARHLMERVLPEINRDPGTIEECFAAFLKEYGEHWNVRTKPYPGVPEMLDALQARGLKMAVLSNKPADFTRNCVYEILSKWKFDPVIGAENGIPSKPDPAGALAIAERLGIPPEGFVYLGDSGVDMKTANAAGMFAVGALWGFRSREELQQEGAKILLERPQDIISLFQPG
jgi:phosphoglycolate phosphatase